MYFCFIVQNCRAEGVAFALTSCGVALAPTEGGGTGERDPLS